MNVILFCMYPLPEYEKPDFLIIGMDKQPLIDAIDEHMSQYDFYNEQMTTLIIYIPEISAFYKIREKEDSLPQELDSLQIIKRRLSHPNAEELLSLCKLHGLCRDYEKYYKQE